MSYKDRLSVRFFAQGFGFVLLLLLFSFRLFLRVRFRTKILSKLIKEIIYSNAGNL